MPISLNGDGVVSGVSTLTNPSEITVGTGASVFSPSANTLALGTNDSERVRIDSSGLLLVGTNSDGTGRRLQVEGTDYSSSTFSARRESADAGGSSIELYKSRGSSFNIVSDDDQLGYIRFYGSQGSADAEAARIRVDVDGSPSSTSMPGRLMFFTTPSGTTAPVERMRILSTGVPQFSSTGSFYADTTAPSFVVNSNGGHSLVANNTNSTDPRGIFIVHGTDVNNATSYFLRCIAGGTNRAYIYSNGGIANYSGNNSNLSDEREKKNIETLDSTWGCLKNWELKKFHYNEDADTDDKRYGVIAQQVAPHCPEVITDWVKQEAKSAELDDDGNVVTPAQEEIVRMGVKEQQMYWMAIKALQEAQTRIETLETANASQAATIAALDARLTALESN